MINEPFGWTWILVGFLSGAVIGMRFMEREWLGGYNALPRRLVRLGHISFLGLGILNILFAQSAERVHLDATWISVASWSFIVGGVSMPLCCGLCAWKSSLHPAFVVPVGSLLTGVTLVVYGMCKP